MEANDIKERLRVFTVHDDWKHIENVKFKSIPWINNRDYFVM